MKNTLLSSKFKTIEKLIKSGIDSDEKIKKNNYWWYVEY